MGLFKILQQGLLGFADQNSKIVHFISGCHAHRVKSPFEQNGATGFDMVDGPQIIIMLISKLSPKSILRIKSKMVNLFKRSFNAFSIFIDYACSL